MDFILGKKKKPTRDETLGNAVKKLKQTELLIMSNMRLYSERAREAEERARAHASRRPDRARYFIRQKNMYEKQLAQMEKQLATVQSQLSAMEMDKISTEVVKTMQVTTQAIKSTSRPGTKDRINDLMDDAAFYTEEMEGITEAVSGPNPVDDAEAIEEELAAMVCDSLPSIDGGVKIPFPPETIEEIPTTSLPQETHVEDMARWAHNL